jgi:hypothetical protein
VRLQDRGLTNYRLWPDNRERSDLDINGDLRMRIDNRCGMNLRGGHVCAESFV